MLCKYTLTAHCACPVDDGRDTYLIECESASMISVEAIIQAVRRFEVERAFQETMTADLARELGCKVTSSGYHSGVLTVAIAP